MCLYSKSVCSGFIPKENVKDYVEYRDKYTNKKCGGEFKQAVEQMEEFIGDPVVRVSVYNAQAICNCIDLT